MATWESRIYANETGTNTEGNYSNVEVVFQIRRMDYNMIGYNNNGSACWQINCDGQDTGRVYFTFNWNNTSPGTWWTVATRTFTVYHNSDGKKDISFWGNFWSGVNPNFFNASGSKTLSTIPRFAGITSFSIQSIDLTNATFKWSSDKPISKLWYSVNEASWQEIGVTDTFTINGLQPNTQYRVKICIRNRESGKDTYSGIATFTTRQITTITNSGFSIDIGNPIHLQLSNPRSESFIRLYYKVNGDWLQLTGTTGITTDTYRLETSPYADTIYQNIITTTEVSFKIICGCILNGKEYSNTYYGTGYIRDATPTPCDGNGWIESKAMHTLFGDIVSGLIYRDSVVVSIKTKATPMKYAKIAYYNISFGNENEMTIKRINENLNSPTLVALFDTPKVAGTYNMRVEAVDSRGLSVIKEYTKPITIYPYQPPSVSVALKRENDFGSTTSLTLVVHTSRITRNGTDLNTNINIQYRYKEQDTASYTPYRSITASKTIVGENIRYNYTDQNFINLDVKKNYVFEFRVTDSVTTANAGYLVSRGTPIMTIADSNVVLINESPTDETITGSCPLSVGGDIMLRDKKGTRRQVMDELTKRITFTTGEVEPVNALDDTLWCPIIATITL